MKSLTKRQLKILVLFIFGTVLLVVFVVILVVYFQLKNNTVPQSTVNKNGQQGSKEKPGTGGTVGAEKGPQDKKDAQGRPLKTTGSIQETDEGVLFSRSETDVNTMKPKNNNSTGQKVTKGNNEASTAEPLKSDQTGNATEPHTENTKAETVEKKQLTAESSIKVSEDEKQLTTESLTTEALNTLNSQQMDNLILKSKAVSASTPAETLTLNSNVALFSLAKKVKDEYALDANAQAWMKSGFRMQRNKDFSDNKDFENLWNSHLALPKDDKKRAIFKEMLKMASDAARNRAMLYEESGKYEECEDNIVEATIAEYLQLKVMSDRA